MPTDPPLSRLRSVARAEVRFLWDATRRGFRAGFLVVGILAFLFITKEVLTADAFEGQRGAFMLLGIGYALYVGVFAGLIAGAVSLLWRAVGWWIVVPFILVPATLWLSIAIFDQFLVAQLHDLLAAAEAAALEHDWNVLAAGKAARAGPVMLVILLPLLLVDLGAIALSPAVLWEIGVLVFDVALVLALGTIPGALVSALVLAIAYVRRFRRRHAKLQT
jgi:hypothetical protein